ncbi:aldo/keto reductase [Thiotrichales bacterium 19S3-7]|nr:aldo/keto reductase [Thiotrichales bacterium 19S3-7]MCF6802154.1 aldo/keto reductase [Thiotrichales bacterium 19S3-11]
MNTIMFQMNNQLQIPALGLGTWKAEKGQVYDAVIEAIKIGYRHIDCAWIYGNEEEIGQAISDAIKLNLVKREALFITSKLWNDSHGKENVASAFRKSLSALKLDYIDLYLIHWPVSFIQGTTYPNSQAQLIANNFPLLLETWYEMEKLVNAGYIRSIGVSNFNIKKLTKFLDKVTTKPVVNQVELHPFLAQNDLLDFAKAHQILLTAYSPLGSKGRQVDDTGRSILEHEVIQSISDKYNITCAQVLIAWAINRHSMVIPKSVNPTRLAQNYQAQFIKLDDNDMHLINQLDKNLRYVDGSFCTFENTPFTTDAIWNE